MMQITVELLKLLEPLQDGHAWVMGDRFTTLAEEERQILIVNSASPLLSRQYGQFIYSESCKGIFYNSRGGDLFWIPTEADLLDMLEAVKEVYNVAFYYKSRDKGGSDSDVLVDVSMQMPECVDEMFRASSRYIGLLEAVRWVNGIIKEAKGE